MDTLHTKIFIHQCHREKIDLECQAAQDSNSEWMDQSSQLNINIIYEWIVKENVSAHTDIKFDALLLLLRVYTFYAKTWCQNPWFF